MGRLALRFTALGYLALLLVLPIGLIFYRAFGDGVAHVFNSLTTPEAQRRNCAPPGWARSLGRSIPWEAAKRGTAAGGAALCQNMLDTAQQRVYTVVAPIPTRSSVPMGGGICSES